MKKPRVSINKKKHVNRSNLQTYYFQIAAQKILDYTTYKTIAGLAEEYIKNNK